jgi:hypothetical protein
MRKRIIAGAAFFLLITCSVLSQALQAVDASYEWSGELVSVDAAAKSVTVKARVLDAVGAADAKRFKAGDRVLLVWSGATFTDAIRRILPNGEQPKAGDELLLSVEFVATDSASNYLTFRVHVPESGVMALKSLKAGDWVRATCANASRDERAVRSITPYTAASGGTVGKT